MRRLVYRPETWWTGVRGHGEHFLMPWKTQNTMSLRQEFVELARLESSNIRQLCRRFGISPTTATNGSSVTSKQAPRDWEIVHAVLTTPPTQVAQEIEQQVVALRQQHPEWGARKIRRVPPNRGTHTFARAQHINGILRRHHLLDSPRPQRDLQRFERKEPNERRWISRDISPPKKVAATPSPFWMIIHVIAWGSSPANRRTPPPCNLF